MPLLFEPRNETKTPKTIACATIVRKVDNEYRLLYDCKPVDKMKSEIGKIKGAKGGCIVIIRREGDKVRVESKCGPINQLKSLLEQF